MPKQSILIMDNLSCHKGRDVDELCAKHSIKIVYLPPYSPELNPIEKCWARIKRKVYQLFDPFVDEFYCVLKNVLEAVSIANNAVPIF